MLFRIGISSRLPRGLWQLTGAAAMISCIGCGGISTHYHVEMQPTAGGYVRTVDVASNPAPVPEEGEPEPSPASESERKIFAAIYGPGQQQPEAERYQREFSAETPADIGGSGSLVRLTTELGDVLVYHERFRGSLPTLREQLTRQAAIDQVIQWVLGWLDEELAGLEGAGEVKRFVDHDLRTDLQDLVCLLEITGSQLCEPDPNNHRGPLLVGHFLIERGYLSVTDLAELPLSEWSQEQTLSWMVAKLRRRFAAASGLPPDVAALSLLNEPQTLAVRFEAYLAQTTEYRAWLDQQTQTQPHPALDPSDFLGETLNPVVGPLFAVLLNWRGPDKLTLVLHTQVEPIETNGKWESENGYVSWAWRLSPRPESVSAKPASADGENGLASERSRPAGEASWIESGLPRVAFAQWAQPDRGKQAALFGEVLIQGQALRDYCVWRKNLDPDQTLRWTALLERLAPLTPENRIAALLEFDERWTGETEIPGVVKQVAQGLLAPTPD